MEAVYPSRLQCPQTMCLSRVAISHSSPYFLIGVPLVGVEPTCSEERLLLRQVRIPFHQSGSDAVRRVELYAHTLTGTRI